MIKLLISLLFIAQITFNASAQQDTAKKAPAPKEDFKDDWATLHKYAAENTALPPPAPGEKRVVFLGSSIFEFWKQKVPAFFEGKPYVNRGIAGQISGQLLIRFRQDVIDLKPKAVIILAGSNDLAGTTGHVTNQTIMDNIKSMVELAEANKIKPILCAYLPIFDYPWRKGLEPADKIIALNKEIEAYANQKKLVLLDYFTPLKDERNGQRADLTTDGAHPNVAGYQIMAKITEEAIAKALK
ncbi:SGNH/GDSL hydrolase family protein [Mucilaginibacter myungsuensis]|uniref:SGNH/GDSL hydrolase family protein n=1 Tax=Mucilaginibacter myungsuensis TaxID=649104 RepID=A0A929KTU1_9SPHI|nr:SGNH/GDSL hydrolase family protein [Mucilaginibacter myungsuensis]MBE9661062.1 SGNH/GDSL hydrolase family protein [Mucilaginibacter myungsuensis]MDN3597206.1 SGNH/GDSL hydrolase family protein [Mucilaginibacter myungsuensis]